MGAIAVAGFVEEVFATGVAVRVAQATKESVDASARGGRIRIAIPSVYGTFARDVARISILVSDP